MADAPVNASEQAALDRFADECGCPTCLAADRGGAGPRVMRALAPIPGESLMGLLTRCARRDHLGSVQPLLNATGVAWHWRFNLALRQDVAFGRLAHVARLPPHEVEARRHTRSTLLRGLDGVAFHGAIAPIYDVRVGTRRMAPLSLGDAPHHSALGDHALVTHCPKTGQHLLDHCPRCTVRLTWSTTAIETCAACGCDLRDQRTEILSKAVRDETGLMIDLIHPDPQRHAAAAATLPAQLAQLDRGAAFELGWRMGCTLTGRGPRARDAALRLPVDVRVSIIAAGSDALRRWPESVVDALRNGSALGGGSAAAMAVGIRDVLQSQNLWPSLRPVIVEAAPGLSHCAASAIRSATPGSIRGTEVQGALGVSRGIFRRLSRSPILEPIIATGEKHRRRVFSDSHMEDVRASLDDRMEQRSAGWRLGISQHGLEQLCCLGALVAIDNDVARAALDRRHLRRSSLEALVADIRGARVERTIEGAIPLRRAMLAVGGRRKPWGPVILALVAGQIDFNLEDGVDELLAERLLIAPDDAGALASLSFDEAAHGGFAFERDMQRQDVEETLNLSMRQFQEAIADGEVGTGPYDRMDVEDLASRYISGGEILMRWCGGAGRRKPEAFRGPGRLVRAARLGWRRDEVEDRLSDLPDVTVQD